MPTATENWKSLKHMNVDVHRGFHRPSLYTTGSILNPSLPLTRYFGHAWGSIPAAATSQDHITIGCGFPRTIGTSFNKTRTGIFSCLNLKRSSAMLSKIPEPSGDTGVQPVKEEKAFQ